MQARVAISFLCLATITACGNGGSPPRSFPEPSTSAEPNPSPNFDGSAFTYSRTATTTGQGFLIGFTCENPQSSNTETTAATIVAQVKTGQTFGSQSNLIAVTSKTSLQNCSDGDEPTAETDYFATTAGNGGTTIVSLVGSTSTYTNGSSFASLNETIEATYALPGTSTSSAASTVMTKYSDGSYVNVRQTNADGSYVDTSTTAPGIFAYQGATTTENADGSGAQMLVYGSNASAPPYTTSYGAPSNGTVTVSTSGTYPVPPDAPSPIASATPMSSPSPNPTDYAWYPYVPSASQPLESISSIDEGPKTLPSDCQSVGVYPKSGDLIKTTDAKLDIFVGTKTVVTEAYMDPNFGLLCLHETSTLKFYQLGPTSADTTPVYTDTLDYVDILQSAVLKSATSRRRTEARAVMIGLTRFEARQAHPAKP